MYSLVLAQHRWYRRCRRHCHDHHVLRSVELFHCGWGLARFSEVLYARIRGPHKEEDEGGAQGLDDAAAVVVVEDRVAVVDEMGDVRDMVVAVADADSGQVAGTVDIEGRYNKSEPLEYIEYLLIGSRPIRPCPTTSSSGQNSTVCTVARQRISGGVP